MIAIPFQPLSVIGIAVAFYMGFKNSQSYDRFWEDRKIWGGIVNYSRSWAMNVLSLLEDSPEDKKILIYRHIAWINALRIQLRQPTSFSIKENKAVERLFDKHGRAQSCVRCFRAVSRCFGSIGVTKTKKCSYIFGQKPGNTPQISLTND